MRDRPILFSGQMVRALLDGSKTQTRRLVKGAEDMEQLLGMIERPPSGDQEPRLKAWMQYRADAGQQMASAEIACPYGKPGDLLWVKETWQAQEAFDGMTPTEIGEAFQEEHGGEPWAPIRYVADGKCEGSVDQWQESPVGKTRVSLHMPRWASRMTLEITEIRVERAQSISLTDTRAEGCEVREFWLFGADAEKRQKIAAGVYGNLWSEINGRESWDANPWVWAITFKVRHENVADVLLDRANR